MSSDYAQTVSDKAGLSEKTPVIGREVMTEFLRHCTYGSCLKDSPKEALQDLMAFIADYFGITEELSFDQKKEFLMLYNAKKEEKTYWEKTIAGKAD
jgi:hypothetical protein